jgi:ribosomal protein L11 methyltransferase
VRPPAWVEISIDLPPAAHEAMSGCLFELGCEGLVMEETCVKGYLAIPQDLDSVRSKLLLFLERLSIPFPEIGSPSPSITPVETGDWSENWRRFFRAEKATPRLLIVPVWESPLPDWNGEVILMDPGPAFGTGKHETTRMCLLSLERANLEPGWSMLDVGTGSGILAIYGAKLGARRILAVDNDPEALRWAERNIGLNKVSDKIELTGRPVTSLEERFTLLTANLTVGPILELLPIFSRLLCPGGRLVLSGLLREQSKEVRKRLGGQALLYGRTLYRGEWACILAEKK